jgi:hypothetical protein
MRLPVKFWIVAGALLLVNLVVYATRVGGPVVLNWTSSLLPVGCAAVGIAGIMSAVLSLKAWDRTKVAWLLLAVGMALSAAGEISYFALDAIMGVDVEAMGSSVADVFWMAAYLPYLASLFILLDGYRRSGLPMGRARKFSLAIVAGFLAAAAIAIWLLVPILEDGETGLLEKVVYLFYPIGDFLLLVPATLLILVTAQFGRGLVSVPWKCVAVAFLLWGAADIVYSYLAWNELYGDGNLIDAFWNVSYLLIGAAGLQQKNVLRSA